MRDARALALPRPGTGNQRVLFACRCCGGVWLEQASPAKGGRDRLAPQQCASLRRYANSQVAAVLRQCCTAVDPTAAVSGNNDDSDNDDGDNSNGDDGRNKRSARVRMPSVFVAVCVAKVDKSARSCLLSARPLLDVWCFMPIYVGGNVVCMCVRACAYCVRLFNFDRQPPSTCHHPTTGPQGCCLPSLCSCHGFV